MRADPFMRLLVDALDEACANADALLLNTANSIEVGLREWKMEASHQKARAGKAEAERDEARRMTRLYEQSCVRLATEVNAADADSHRFIVSRLT